MTTIQSASFPPVSRGTPKRIPRVLIRLTKTLNGNHQTREFQPLLWNSRRESEGISPNPQVLPECASSV